MDPKEYMDLSAPDLTNHSRIRRRTHVGESVEIIRPKSEREFHLTFDPKSSIIERFTGNVQIYWNGRIVLGPKWLSGFTVSFTTMIAIFGLFYFNIITRLRGEKFSAIQIACNLEIFLFFISLILMLLTGLSNPGIIPRDPREPCARADVDPLSIDTTTGFLIPRYLLINGVCVRQKFCRTCKIYRPPRSNHCSVCDNCVLKFDHHCMALGTCIGLGNYRWFLLLVIDLTMLCASMVWVIRYQLTAADPAASVSEFMSIHAFEFFLLAISIAGFLAFGLLAVYHFFITSHNLTTNEHVKKYYKVNPFDCGNRWVNIAHALWYPQKLLPVVAIGLEDGHVEASYRELASTNSECVSDFYDY